MGSSSQNSKSPSRFSFVIIFFSGDRLQRRNYLALCVVAFLLTVGEKFATAQEWQRLGPPGGNVISIAAAGSNTLYLGMADGHIYFSDDGAIHWQLRGRVNARLDGVVQRLLV